MHPTTTAALQAYANAREQLAAQLECDRFFVSDAGQALPYSTVRGVFRKLCDSQSITGNGRRRPRLHDLRHTFACRRIEQCYDSHADVDQAVSALSVYLGHAKVSDTYWYVTATPDLIARAAQRFEAFAALVVQEVQP
jgi:integrase